MPHELKLIGLVGFSTVWGELRLQEDWISLNRVRSAHESCETWCIK